MRRTIFTAVIAVTAAVTLTACGNKSSLPGGETALRRANVSAETPAITHGAQLFAQRCSGCHTLDVSGSEGSASQVRDRERVDGPNFNVRRETKETVLYAIRNGGYSGAIMPENIVVGKDAEDVAEFLGKYAGAQQGDIPLESNAPQDAG